MSNYRLSLKSVYSFTYEHLTKTRMHSSGMRTARLLTVSKHALWPVWGDLGGVPARGGVPAQVPPL